MEQELKKHPDYPIEYITGKVNFFGREYSVTPDVLIPRLETESLVRRARDIIKSGKFAKVVDIGCGSGIIGTSVADLVDEVIFLDISEGALAVAEANFRTHFPEKKAEFILSDLISELPLASSIHHPANTLFLTNLPYIRGEDWEHMSPDTRFEPKMALFGGGETGFELYERLFAQIKNREVHMSRMVIEFGFDQRHIVESVIQSYGWSYEFFSDYAGIERFCDIIHSDL